MNWQPMETAPKDRYVLIYTESACVGFVYLACYDADEHNSWEYEKFPSKEDKVGWWTFRVSCSEDKLCKENLTEPLYWTDFNPPSTADIVNGY